MKISASVEEEEGGEALARSRDRKEELYTLERAITDWGILEWRRKKGGEGTTNFTSHSSSPPERAQTPLGGAASEDKHRTSDGKVL